MYAVTVRRLSSWLPSNEGARHTGYDPANKSRTRRHVPPEVRQVFNERTKVVAFAVAAAGIEPA